MDLSALIQAAHGGDAVGSIAQQFGISPEQATAAINALAPALSQGLQNHIQSGEGLSQIVGHLTDPAHQATFDDPNAAQAPAAASAGGDLLGQIFGSAGVSQIAQHIGAETGIDPSVLSNLMPVVASMAAGGVGKTLQDSGMGGLLSQLGGAAGQGAGGLGSILGSVASAVQGGQSGGIGGMISSVVGSLFGGGAPAAGAPAAGAAPAAGGGLDPALMQAGMSALSGLFQSGQGSSALQGVLGQILAKR